MRNQLVFLAVTGMALTAFAQADPATTEGCMHARTSFDLIVHASYAETAPLFGPNGERAWAGADWAPRFIHPQPPLDAEGAVFTVQTGRHKSIWVNTLFDVEGRHFQYVYFLPDLMVTVIDVRFKPVTADSTEVNVVYTRTALTPQGNPHVAAMREHDLKAGKEWQQAIDAYLGQHKSASEH